MRCQKCNSKFPTPTVVGGVAYFVCAGCGHCHEIENFKNLSKGERVKLFELEYNVALPEAFVSYDQPTGSWLVKLPDSSSQGFRDHFGEGYVCIDGIWGLQLYEGSSVFQTQRLIKEWNLPERLVLIAGNGHYWLALDYRERRKDPPVIVIVTDTGESLQVARSFAELLTLRQRHEEVFDADGSLLAGESPGQGPAID